MKDGDPETQRRLHSLFEKFGWDNPACVVCGHDNPFGLELRHIVGRRYDGRTVMLCGTCRRRELYRCDPQQQGCSSSDRDRFARYLSHRAFLFEEWAERLRNEARMLFQVGRQSSPDKSRTLH